MEDNLQSHNNKNIIKSQSKKNIYITILTKTEEHHFIKIFKKTQNIKILKKIIESNLLYVIKIARAYSGYGISIKDLTQEGIIGLMKALKNFNTQKNTRLISFAIYWIKAEIHSYIIKNSSIIKIANTKIQKKLFFNIKNYQNVNNLNTCEKSSILNLFSAKMKDIENITSTFKKKIYIGDENTQKILITNNTTLYSKDYFLTKEKNTWNNFLIRKLKNAINKLDERSKNILKNRWLKKKKNYIKRTINII